MEKPQKFYPQQNQHIKIIKFKQILETPEKKTVNLDDPKDDLFKDNEIFADMKNPIFVPFT